MEFLTKFGLNLLGTAKIDAAAEPFCVAKFLSKRRFMGVLGAKPPRSYTIYTTV